jgi:hypothetical protein
LFSEFFFEIINERDEPLVLAFETVKAFFKFQEYKKLVYEESIHTFVDFDAYKNLKDSEDFE